MLVHSGGVHGGHYYAYIRPDGKTWLKFDDTAVTIEDERKALDEQFGGEDEPLPAGSPAALKPVRLVQLAAGTSATYDRLPYAVATRSCWRPIVSQSSKVLARTAVSGVICGKINCCCCSPQALDNQQWNTCVYSVASCVIAGSRQQSKS